MHARVKRWWDVRRKTRLLNQTITSSKTDSLGAGKEERAAVRAPSCLCPIDRSPHVALRRTHPPRLLLENPGLYRVHSRRVNLHFFLVMFYTSDRWPVWFVWSVWSVWSSSCCRVGAEWCERSGSHFRGLDLYCIDPTRHFITAGYDLDHLQ